MGLGVPVIVCCSNPSLVLEHTADFIHSFIQKSLYPTFPLPRPIPKVASIWASSVTWTESDAQKHEFLELLSPLTWKGRAREGSSVTVRLYVTICLYVKVLSELVIYNIGHWRSWPLCPTGDRHACATPSLPGDAITSGSSSKAGVALSGCPFSLFLWKGKMGCPNSGVELQLQLATMAWNWELQPVLVLLHTFFTFKERGRRG